MKRNECEGAAAYCTCGCTRLVATRYDWDEGCNYDVSMETSNIRYNCNSLRERIVDSLKVLFGKRPSYADMSFDSKEEFERWLDECKKLIK